MYIRKEVELKTGHVAEHWEVTSLSIVKDNNKFVGKVRMSVWKDSQAKADLKDPCSFTLDFNLPELHQSIDREIYESIIENGRYENKKFFKDSVIGEE
jgi:hypothetical protein